MNKRFIIIAGANGTGKTTLAIEFLKKNKIAFLNADNIALSISKDLGKNRIKAGKQFIAKLENCITLKRSLAIESTLAGKYLIRTIKRVKKLGYTISIIYFFVDTPAVALARIKSRVEAGGHDVPKEDVIRRFSRSKINFWTIYRPLADEWALFYNGMERLIPVASGGKKDFDIINEELFSLFNKENR
ncbi:MAG: AAA family ATPase [Candidatus Saganbacteria bacterium]|nr:AAA family ATPase [Candidatus Saganbacteria bacterium]